MADPTAKNVLSLFVTVGSRLSELVIKDGQLIFVRDKHRIALDFGGKRTFYNQIEEISTEEERQLLVPENGVYYFVINTNILWTYQDEWIQLTTPPTDILFIGLELPELGQKDKLYVNKGDKEISIWDEETGKYIAVSNYTNEVTDEDIENLFN